MTNAPDDRRLLAILSTDIAGYTSLTERDEGAAIRARDRHHSLVRALVTQFDGEVVDATGDESLSTFPNALHAVDCALALQAALRDDRELAVRIGIHLGDVTRHGAAVIGEGVNVAARIRPLSEPGGIAISESVYQAVRTRRHIRTTSLGAKALKNVSAPVNVFSVSTEPSTPKPARVGRRARWAIAVSLALLVAGWGIWSQYRVELLASIALAAPRYFSSPVPQKIGFATTADGVRIAYATTGSGPPLILVLGWGTHLEQGLGSPLYDQLGWVATLSDYNTLVRYDGRGFGLSERNVTDFSLDARVSDIEAIVDALGFERFAVYGISAGGPAAIAYTVRHPERVTRLLLIATHAGWASIPLSPDAVAGSRGITETMRTTWNSRAVRDMWVSVIYPDADDVTRRVLNEFLRVSGDGPAVAGFFDAYFGEDVSGELRAIRVPVMIIHGDEDTTVPLAYGVKLASLLPAARFEIIHGGGHQAFMEPRALKFVKDFLAQPD